MNDEARPSGDRSRHRAPRRRSRWGRRTRAVAVSGVAFAKDLKGTVMTDAEMDKVTAGSKPDNPGFGRNTAGEAGGDLGRSNPSFPAGQGRCTALQHGGNVHGIVLCSVN